MKYKIVYFSPDGLPDGFHAIDAENKEQAEIKFRLLYPDLDRFSVLLTRAETPKVVCDPIREPINRDAARILRPLSDHVEAKEWSEAEIERIRWDGLISQCPYCGARAYQGGYCFGCERFISQHEGVSKSKDENGA